MKICKHGSISIFEIPKEFIRGHNVNINIHKRFPRPAGYKLQAAGHRRQAASYRQQATGEGHQGR